MEEEEEVVADEEVKEQAATAAPERTIPASRRVKKMEQSTDRQVALGGSLPVAVNTS